MASHFSESIKDPGSLFMRTRNHVLPSSVIDIVSETASAADYWILITQNRAIPYTSAPEQFPLAADLYTRLRAGRLGFERTARYTHPASIFGFEFDDEDTDPTISGFDRPTIEVYRRTSRHDSLREVWKHEVISDSRNPDKMILSGISVYRKGRFEAALKIFESAVQRYPDSKLAKLCEVEAMYKTAGADGAKQAFMDAIVSQWDFAGLTLAGIPERGAEYIRITQERKPKTAENLYLRQLASRAFIKLGYDSQNAGDTDRAIEWYENAIELDRKYLRPFRALGQLYLEKDQFEASRDAFSEAIKIRSHIDELWIGLAIAESRLGNVSAAYKAVRTAMEMAPGKALYHLVLIGLEEYFRSAGQDAWANEIRRYVDI